MLRVFLEHASDEEFRTWGHVVGDHEVVIGDLLVQVLVILTSVRETTAEKGEEKDSGGVDVRRWSTELDLFDYLRRHVRRRPAEELDLLSVGNLRAEPKVDQFDVGPMVEHDIF